MEFRPLTEPPQDPAPDCLVFNPGKLFSSLPDTGFGLIKTVKHQGCGCLEDPAPAPHRLTTKNPEDTENQLAVLRVGCHSQLCLGTLPTHHSSGPGLYQPVVEGQRLHDGGVSLGAFLELLKRQLPVSILQTERRLKVAIHLQGQGSQACPWLASTELPESSGVFRGGETLIRYLALLTHLP